MTRKVHEHRPVQITDATREDTLIVCICGKRCIAKTLDAAWDIYDEHTMEE